MLNVFSKRPEADDVSEEPLSGSAPTPARRLSWGPFEAIIITLLNFVLSNFGAALVLGLVVIGLILPAFGVSAGEFSSFLDGSVEQFTFVLVAEAMALGFLWWFMRRRRATLGDIGLGRKPRWSDAGWGLLGFLCYFGIYIVVALISQWMGIDTQQKQDIGIDTYGQSALGLGLIFVSLVILPPVAEEIIFRGFLFSGLRRAWKVGASILFTSLLFGALHLFGGLSGEGLLWIAGIDTFILSLVLCYLRFNTGSLWAPIFVHAAKNGLAFISLFILHVA